jgi:hypothetical protein
MKLRTLFVAVALAFIVVTTANATTFEINAIVDISNPNPPSSITGSFTMDNNDPGTIANINIDAIMPLYGNPFEITFDQVMYPTATWPLGYLWFANSNYSAGSTHFFMFLTPESPTSYSIGMGFDNHQSEIVVASVGVGWQYIFGELTAVTAVPLPPTLPLFATALGILGLLGWRTQRRPVSGDSPRQKKAP